MLLYTLISATIGDKLSLTERPNTIRLPTGNMTLRTVVLLSSFMTEPRGTCEMCIESSRKKGMG